MSGIIDLDEFIESAKSLAQEAEEGRRIKEAATKGYVKTDQFHRKADALMDERLREMAVEVVFGIWNEQKRDVTLDEIYHGVHKKVSQDLENGEWPRIWSVPSKRTVDRRVNETADKNHPEFWHGFDNPPCVCIRAGRYRPNPSLFEEAVKEEISA
jgi:hypothetical protein